MEPRLTVAFVLIASSAILLSGCIGLSHKEIEAAYEDADVRYHRKDSAAISMRLDSFQVPSGTSTLEIKWAYRASEQIHIEIKDRSGAHKHNLTTLHSGLGAASEQGTWTQADPPAGEWTIETRLYRNGAYTVGIYFQ
jgi:hypothetical protein